MAAMVIVAAATSCASTPAPPELAPAGPAMPTTPTPAPDPGLDRLVLAPGDLPPGWAPDTSGSAMTSRANLTGRLCPEGTSRIDRLPPGASDVAVQRSPLGPFVVQSLAPSADAEAYHRNLLDALTVCVGRTWITGVDGESFTYTLDERTAAAVGDGFRRFHLAAHGGPGFSFSADYLLARRRDVVELYAGLSVHGTAGAEDLDDSEYAAIVHAGDRRIANAPTTGSPATGTGTYVPSM